MFDFRNKGAKVLTLLYLHALPRKTRQDSPHNSAFALLLYKSCELRHLPYFRVEPFIYSYCL